MADIVTVDLKNVKSAELARITDSLGLSTAEEIADFLEAYLIKEVGDQELYKIKQNSKKVQIKLKLK